MNRFFFIPFAALSLLATISCKPPAAAQGATLSAAAEDAKTTAIVFLKWYFQHKPALDRLQVIKGGGTNTTFPNYYVDDSAAAHYLSLLASSGYLSTTYLDSARSFIRRMGGSLSKHPQNDGIIEGWQVDFVLKKMDYMGIQEHVDAPHIVASALKQHRLTLTLGFDESESMVFVFSKKGNQWMIDQINGEFIVKIPYH